MEKIKGHKQYLYLSAVIIALGITFTTTMKDYVGALGVVFIAIGGLLFITGMNMKKKEENKK
ncbi:MAG: hypothetical protein ABFR32_07875 [Bacteroidota bacterium]